MTLKQAIKGNAVRLFLGLLVLCALLYACFFTIMIGRYDDKHWADRLSERTLSPIYGRDDVLVGAIQSAGTKTNSTSTYDLGFIPLPAKTPIPPAYRAALLEREDRGLRDGGFLHIFGVDLPRMLWAWANLRGGSSLTMQIVKNLEGWGNEKTLVQKILRKLEELPASIQLYRYIANQGDDTQSAVVRLYAGIHKIWTPDTGIRGIEAGARVTFDTTPDKLSIAQQLLLSAVTGIPLAPPGEHNASTLPCQKIWPKKQNEAYDSNVEDRILGSSSDFEIRQFRIRKSQCRTIWRAKHTAQKLFEAGYVFNSQEALRQTLDELDSYESEGIRPVNPFSGLSDRESVSISKRTREVVTPHLLNLLYLESKTFRRDIVGEPLRTNLLSGEQSEFVADVQNRLAKIDNDPNRILCIPLVSDAKSPVWQSSCRGRGAGSKAIVYAGAIDTSTGLLKRSYSNYGEVFEAKFSIGSLAKLPILVAAVKAGYNENSKLCPKSATRNGKRLRRVTEPKTGYADCAAASRLLTLSDATARSDNLAFYELAMSLGSDALNSVLSDLELPQVGDPAYELSFGLYEASISQTLKLSQIVVARANGLLVRGKAPKLLTGSATTLNKALMPLTDAQSNELKKLIDSPVKSSSGTLRRLDALGVSGGKTGTSNSSRLTDQEENFVSGKWAVFYSASSQTLGLLAIASPRPSIPLADPRIRGAMFVDIEKLVIGKQ